MDKNTRELLQFMANYRLKEDPLDLINKLATFLKEKWGTGEVFAFSTLKNKNGPQSDIKYSFRNILNKPFKEFGIREADAMEFLEHVQDSEIESSSILQLEINSTYFTALYGGENDLQKFIFIFTADHFNEIPQEQITYLVDFCKNSLKEILNLKKLKEENALVDVDDVTGLFNSRRLNKDVEEAIQRYNKTGEIFSILFVDIDHFKRVNDGHGHLIGTKLLSDMARVLKLVLRKTDYLYRYGGDEFVIIVRGANTENAKFIGERALKTVKEKVFGSGFDFERSKKFRLSVSIGIASFPEDARTKEEVMALADQMMYQAKSEGRGKVCLAKSLFHSKI